MKFDLRKAIEEVALNEQKKEERNLKIKLMNVQTRKILNHIKCIKVIKK